jgi:hypothetical protein
MKSSLFGLLAALGVDLPKQNRSLGKVPGFWFSDAMVVVEIGVGLLLLLALGAYVWMKFRRRRRRHVRGGQKVFRGSHSHEDGEASDIEGHDSAEESDSEPDDDDEEEDEEEGEHHHRHHHGRRRYKYRVRRRGHRTRNPTLAETGGLPPVRTQEPGKPC